MDKQNNLTINYATVQEHSLETQNSATNNVETYSISLCICTMNRAEDLDRCLASVFESQVQPDEVIVSDDSPDPRPTQGVVAKYPGVTYQSAPKRGLGANRNACIKNARGSHIIFIDDDVCVPVGFFEVAKKIITDQPESVITGYEMNHGGGGRWTGKVRKVIPHNADFWGLQCVPIQDDYCAVVINAAIFPRTLFNDALFDENLRYGSEEIDMAKHAVSLGYQIIYDDNLYVHHYPSAVNREHYKQFIHASRLYATTKAYLYYDRSIFKALIFAVFAPGKLALALVKRGDIWGWWKAIQATAIAVNYFLNKRSL